MWKCKIARTFWKTGVLLFLLCPPLVRGIGLSPCGVDGVQEILADQETHFTCTGEKATQWTLRSDGHKLVLAQYDKQLEHLETIDELFVGRIIDAHRSSMTIKRVNNAKVHTNIKLLNGSLECSLTGEDNQSATCGLNYVYPPQDVSCTAVNSSWSVSVSCFIKSVYSSRKHYTCQLIRLKDKMKNETLESVSMVTSPTSEKITKSEVKVSGSCGFNTTLPPEEGKYEFFVSVSPGGRHFGTRDKLFTAEPAESPTISCVPHPYVLENTYITCTCRTTSLGHPAGYLRLTRGNQTNKETLVKEVSTPQALSHTQFLTQSDHSKTWFRCDVVWGTQEILGDNYTANVGYAPKTSKLSFSDSVGNATVMENHRVHLRCQSDGRPTPNVSISNNDNLTVIVRASSPANYIFIARCEDTATYTCSASNVFSPQSVVTTSFNLDVQCKPRIISTRHIGKIMFRNQTENIAFDIISNPVPHQSNVWFLGAEPNSSSSYCELKEKSAMNITCTSYTDRKYLVKCTLTVFNILPCSGFFKVQVINKHGDENFTVEIIYISTENIDEDETTQHHIAISSGVAAVFVFVVTVVVLTVIIWKKKSSKESSSVFPVLAAASRLPYRSRRDEETDQPSPTPEIIYEIPWDSVPLTMQPPRTHTRVSISKPVRCQTPVYAVVDKTRKKVNTQPAHIAERADDREKTRKDNPKGSKPSSSGVWRGTDTDTDSEYVVLDTIRGKTPARRDNNKKHKPRPDTEKGFVDDEDDSDDYDHLVMQQLPARQDVSARREASACASNLHSEDDGKWVNDDGLIYVTPFFEVAAGVKRRPPPSQEETEYCTLQTSSLKGN